MQQYLLGEAIVSAAKKDGSSEFEYTLPEYLPGISRIVKSTASVEKSVARQDGDELYCDIFLKVGIIYVSDFGGKIKSIFFDEVIKLPMGTLADSGEECTTLPSAFVSSVSSKPQGQRKFTCLCNYHANVMMLKETSRNMPECDSGKGICTLKQTKNLCRKITLPETFSEYEGEISLDSQAKAVGEIIYADAVFCGASCTVSDGHLDYEAKFMLHVLYETAKDEDSAAQAEYTVINAPIVVNDSIQNDKIKAGQQSFIYLDAAQPEPSAAFDGYGENRVISFNLKYSALPILFEKYELEAVIDAFSENAQSSVVITQTDASIPKYTVSDSVTMSQTLKTDIGDLAEISDCSAEILSVTTEYSDSKFFAAAKCLVNIFGITKNKELTCLDSIVTLHVPIMQSISLDSSCVPEILLSVRGCSAEIREGAITVVFDMAVNGVITEKTSLNLVTDLDIDDDACIKKQRGEIVVCYPSQNDRLWDIAKKYRVNPETIAQANNLENEEISSKHILLIP